MTAYWAGDVPDKALMTRDTRYLSDAAADDSLRVDPEAEWTVEVCRATGIAYTRQICVPLDVDELSPWRES